MTGHNNRGLRRLSMRARLAVAAAVLVGGGAAGAVAVAASHSGATAVQSAGFATRGSSHHWVSEQTALTMAVSGWPKQTSQANDTINTLSNMAPMRTFSQVQQHHTMLAVQRGTVIVATKKFLVVRSANHAVHVWQVRGAKFINVASNKTAMKAMTGGTMGMPSQLNWKAKGIAKGDVVFIAGVNERGTLIAKLVLFAAPTTFTPPVTPTATPTMTMTPTATPTSTMPTTSPTATSTATPTGTAPAPTGTAPTFTGNNS